MFTHEDVKDLVAGKKVLEAQMDAPVEYIVFDHVVVLNTHYLKK